MASQIPAWVAEYIGIPFIERGRARAGLDCWGLVVLVLRERFGIALPSYACYETLAGESDRAAIAAALRAGLVAEWEPVAERDAAGALALGAERLGDGVLMTIPGRAPHCGLVVGDRRMLHIERGINSCLARYDRGGWSRRVAGIYRPRMAEGAAA